MDTKLNHSELSTLLSQETSLSLAKAEQFTKNFFDIIIEGLEKDGIVKVNGLGTFKVIDVASRNSINVNTGEKFEIKGHRKITFIPADSLKEKVNMPFAMFEPVEVTDDYCELETEEDNDADELDELVKDSSEEQTEAHSEAANNVAVEEPADEPATEDNSPAETTEEQPMESADAPTNNSSAEESEPAEVVEEEKIAEPANLQANDPATEETAPIEPVQEEKVEQKEPLATNEEKESAVISVKSSGTTKRSRKTTFTIVATLFIILVVAGAGVYIHFTMPEYFTGTAKIKDKEIIEKSLAAADSKLNVGNINERADAQAENNPDTTVTTDTQPADTNDVEAQDAATTMPEDKTAAEAHIVAAQDEPKAVENKVQNTIEPSDAPFVLVPALSERSLASITLADTTIYKAVGEIAEHRVSSNETLTRIALKYYKDKRLWPYVVHYNKMSNHNRLEIGMILKIPRLVAK